MPSPLDGPGLDDAALREWRRDIIDDSELLGLGQAHPDLPPGHSIEPVVFKPDPTEVTREAQSKWDAPAPECNPIPVELVRGGSGPGEGVDEWYLLVDGVRMSPMKLNSLLDDSEEIYRLPSPFKDDTERIGDADTVRPLAFAVRIEAEAAMPAEVTLVVEEVVKSSERLHPLPDAANTRWKDAISEAIYNENHGTEQVKEVKRVDMKPYTPEDLTAPLYSMPYPFRAHAQSSFAILNTRPQENEKSMAKIVADFAVNFAESNTRSKWLFEQQASVIEAVSAHQKAVFNLKTAQYGMDLAKWQSKKALDLKKTQSSLDKYPQRIADATARRDRAVQRQQNPPVRARLDGGEAARDRERRARVDRENKSLETFQDKKTELENHMTRIRFRETPKLPKYKSITIPTSFTKYFMRSNSASKPSGVQVSGGQKNKCVVFGGGAKSALSDVLDQFISLTTALHIVIASELQDKDSDDLFVSRVQKVRKYLVHSNEQKALTLFESLFMTNPEFSKFESTVSSFPEVEAKRKETASRGRKQYMADFKPEKADAYLILDRMNHSELMCSTTRLRYKIKVRDVATREEKEWVIDPSEEYGVRAFTAYSNVARDTQKLKEATDTFLKLLFSAKGERSPIQKCYDTLLSLIPSTSEFSNLMKRAAKMQQDRVRQRTSVEKFKRNLSKRFSIEGAMVTTQVLAFSWQVYTGASLTAVPFASQVLNSVANLWNSIADYENEMSKIKIDEALLLSTQWQNGQYADLFWRMASMSEFRKFIETFVKLIQSEEATEDEYFTKDIIENRKMFVEANAQSLLATFELTKPLLDFEAESEEAGSFILDRETQMFQEGNEQNDQLAEKLAKYYKDLEEAERVKIQQARITVRMPQIVDVKPSPLPSIDSQGIDILCRSAENKPFEARRGIKYVTILKIGTEFLSRLYFAVARELDGKKYVGVALDAFKDNLLTSTFFKYVMGKEDFTSADVAKTGLGAFLGLATLGPVIASILGVVATPATIAVGVSLPVIAYFGIGTESVNLKNEEEKAEFEYKKLSENTLIGGLQASIISATAFLDYQKQSMNTNNDLQEEYKNCLQKLRNSPIKSSIENAASVIRFLRSNDAEKVLFIANRSLDSTGSSRFRLFERFRVERRSLEILKSSMYHPASKSAWDGMPDGFALRFVPPPDIVAAVYEAETLRRVLTKEAISRVAETVAAPRSQSGIDLDRLQASRIHSTFLTAVRDQWLSPGKALTEDVEERRFIGRTAPTTAKLLAVNASKMLSLAFSKPNSSPTTPMSLILEDDLFFDCFAGGGAARLAMRQIPILAEVRQTIEDDFNARFENHGAGFLFAEIYETNWSAERLYAVKRISDAWRQEATTRKEDEFVPQLDLTTACDDAVGAFRRVEALCAISKHDAPKFAVASAMGALWSFLSESADKTQQEAALRALSVANAKMAQSKPADYQKNLIQSKNKKMSSKFSAQLSFAARRLDVRALRRAPVGSVDDLVNALAPVLVGSVEQVEHYFVAGADNLDFSATPLMYSGTVARPIWLQDVVDACEKLRDFIRESRTSDFLPPDVVAIVPRERSRPGYARHPMILTRERVVGEGHKVGVWAHPSSTLIDSKNLRFDDNGTSDLLSALNVLYSGDELRAEKAVTSAKENIERSRVFSFNADRLAAAIRLAAISAEKIEIDLGGPLGTFASHAATAVALAGEIGSRELYLRTFDAAGARVQLDELSAVCKGALDRGFHVVTFAEFSLIGSNL